MQPRRHRVRRVDIRFEYDDDISVKPVDFADISSGSSGSSGSSDSGESTVSTDSGGSTDSLSDDDDGIDVRRMPGKQVIAKMLASLAAFPAHEDDVEKKASLSLSLSVIAQKCGPLCYLDPGFGSMTGKRLFDFFTKPGRLRMFAVACGCSHNDADTDEV